MHINMVYPPTDGHPSMH